MLLAVLSIATAFHPDATAQEPPTPSAVDATANSQEPDRANLEFFESRIRPALIEHCYECHSGQSKIVQGNLRLDSKPGVRDGGDSGPAVVPGNPDESLIIQSLRYGTLQMPPSGKLSDTILRDFETWVLHGATDPRESPSGSNEPENKPWRDPVAIESHWAFRSAPRSVSIPKTNIPSGVPTDLPDWYDASDAAQSPIDHFLRVPLREKGWLPAPLASPAVLMRRATLDLTGLVPTPEEIEAYLADDPDHRYERLVDRLLASPDYGVRWARHWLDCVRYADSNGADENHDMPNAWRYRDWVANALNEDLPFDQFAIQQIAGDLLPQPENEADGARLITATGFWVLGPKMLAEQDKAKMRIDIVDEQIDTFSRTMLGATLSCARCHDHKFDPFTQEDYFAMAGVLMSTRTMADEAFVSKWMERPLPSHEITQKRQSHQQQIDAARKQLAMLKEEANGRLLAEGKVEKIPEDPKALYPPEAQKEVERLIKEIEALEKSMPAFDMSMAVEENKPTDMPIHIRGNHLRPGEHPIPRGVPKILVKANPLPLIPSDQSGRLQLAQWLTHPDHPLFARVMVNRIWMWHMGQGLVSSPSNFGMRGESPTHPELLDWLASEWIQRGWSMKWLHRQILLSSTYRMESNRTDSNAATYAESDPENRLWWRQNTKRMEIEPLRDSILACCGKLDARMGGPGQAIQSPKRTIYLSINRAALADMFSVFDYVDPASHIEQRPVTTVPSQALFLLNSDLVTNSSEWLGQKLAERSNEDRQAVGFAFLAILGRSPTDFELERSVTLLQQSTDAIHQESAGPSTPPNEEQRIQLRPRALATLVRSLIASREFSWIE